MLLTSMEWRDRSGMRQVGRQVTLERLHVQEQAAMTADVWGALPLYHDVYMLYASHVCGVQWSVDDHLARAAAVK